MAQVTPPSTAVFVGPTLPRAVAAAALPHARVEAPLGRGELIRLRSEGVSTFVIIDGVFAQRLAIAPSEVVDTAMAGARVIGASSLGAIRAAECWPAGAEGIGAVYRLYRLAVLRDDDEVAVATDPDAEYAAISIALIHVRWLVLAGLRNELLDRDRCTAVLAAARATRFERRSWAGIFGDAGVSLDSELRKLIAPCDIKRRDAELALRHAAESANDASPRPRPARRRLAPYRMPGGNREVRYHGHDPLFGYPRHELERELAVWLDERDDPEALWERLATTGRLERELMRWYASRRLSPAPRKRHRPPAI
jgi:hypothetical protein